MVFFLYNLIWSLFVLLSIPVILSSKGRHIHERLGLHFPGNPSNRKKIWIHALSVGEVVSALPLVTSIKERYPSRPIAFTVKTAQGMDIARKKLADRVDLLLFMPLDFWWAVRRIVNYIRPSIFILVETDIWPGLIFHLKGKGVGVVLVNGRISPGTFRSYRRYRSLIGKVLNSIDKCLMQTDLDARRLMEIGPWHDKIEAVGNIKFDRSVLPTGEKERDRWLRLMNIGPENRVWVAGSTHQGEDEIILGVFQRLLVQFPDLRLVIAPRRLERVDQIVRLCRERGLVFIKRSELGGEGYHSCKVMILDSIGELERVYGIADVSFVGGSMVPVGGHNLLEPAGIGCPVLFGMHTYNFVRVAQLLIKSGGGIRVRNGDELFSRMEELLFDRDRLGLMSSKAREFVAKNSGALERIMGHIGGYIGTPS